MSSKKLAEKSGEKGLGTPPEQLGAKDLLLEILRLQAMLSSKMFEFMRAYQQKRNYRDDERILRGDEYSEGRVSRILREVNELGVDLGKRLSALLGEDVFERRDEKGRLLLPCKVCEKETAFVRVLDSPYGLPGAYMAGSERLICTECREDVVRPDDERLPKFNSVFRTE